MSDYAIIRKGHMGYFPVKHGINNSETFDSLSMAKMWKEVRQIDGFIVKVVE